MPELTRAQVVLGALALVAVVALGVRWMQGQAARSAGGAAAAGAGATARGPTVRLEPAGGRSALVHVTGAVRRPGVYRLADGARVQDAVRRAGGATSRAATGAINLAARVADGQQVVVPARAAGGGGVAGAAAGDGLVAGGAVAGAGGAGGAAGAVAPPVSLSTATLEQLDTLDGVGPATARKILDYRRQHGGFRSVDDLGQVPGIGPKRLAALRERVQP